MVKRYTIDACVQTNLNYGLKLEIGNYIGRTKLKAQHVSVRWA